MKEYQYIYRNTQKNNKPMISKNETRLFEVQKSFHH